MMPFRCFRSATSTSKVISRKSAESGREADVVDIGARFADQRGNRAERARLVDRRDDDAGREELLALLVEVPAHVEPALRLIVEGGERRRLDWIDGDPLARRQNADDAVARHGAAVRREAHRQVAPQAANRNERASLVPSPGTLKTRLAALLEAEPAGFARAGRARRGFALLA